ncbi:MAG: excisionase family DNA-binding protein [Deltaproteobacteria bacterium]|nr:excisionase family DNA-binding protein [Deltaproteobacteria bacterium]
MSDKYLSTGEAARLCAVTPDTILKWIKSGRLPARRTGGGHFRIREDDVGGLSLGPARAVSAPASPAGRRHFQYCWEYNARDGHPLPGCVECVVYRTRAQRCYEVIKLAAATGHQRIFCKGTCEDCDYYRKVHEQDTNVLVVSDNQILTALLKREAARASFNLETTHCEYHCSALVDSFRPDYVLLDCSLGEQRTQDICAHLLEDPRLPLVRIILAARAGEFPRECDRAVFARIEKPFGIDDIAECLDGISGDADADGERG